MQMLTVIESPLFSRDWPDYWSEAEHDEFVAFLAGTPDAGAVVLALADAARCGGLGQEWASEAGSA